MIRPRRVGAFVVRRTAAPGTDERGQTAVLIIGFMIVVALTVVVVVDATAAYLRRQALDTLAARVPPAGDWINMLGAEGNGQAMGGTLMSVFDIVANGEAIKVTVEP